MEGMYLQQREILFSQDIAQLLGVYLSKAAVGSGRTPSFGSHNIPLPTNDTWTEGAWLSRTKYGASLYRAQWKSFARTTLSKVTASLRSRDHFL